ncbi:unnamed protein product, partial [Brachionus calyciflorus]
LILQLDRIPRLVLMDRTGDYLNINAPYPNEIESL